MKLIAGIVGLVVLLAPQRGAAASLDVSPIVVELSGKAPSALVSLRNGGRAPARVQLRAHTWDESPSGQMVLGDTTELSAYPPLQQLAPGEERKVRIGTSAKPGSKERSWRVFIEELPSAVETQDSTTVRILTRIGIPVFLAPLAPASAGELVITREGGKLQVVVRNTGTVHFPPTNVEVALLGEKDERLEQKSLSGWYVLAGGERIFAVDPDPKTCAMARRVMATATLEKGQLQAVLALPAGACAP